MASLAAVEKLDPVLKEAGIKQLKMRKRLKAELKASGPSETHGNGAVNMVELLEWWESKCFRHSGCEECTQGVKVCGWCNIEEKCVADKPEVCKGPGDHVGHHP